jgi:hypothetical protein
MKHYFPGNNIRKQGKLEKKKEKGGDRRRGEGGRRASKRTQGLETPKWSQWKAKD